MRNAWWRTSRRTLVNVKAALHASATNALRNSVSFVIREVKLKSSVPGPESVPRPLIIVMLFMWKVDYENVQLGVYW